MVSRAWAPGDVLANKFRLIARLGAGGMGVVWRAEHLALRSPIAIKLVHENIMHSEGAADRFLREAQAAASLRSPHVVQVLDFGIDAETPYIVMELLEGESLAERLKRVGRLSFDETANIVAQVARALHKAHEAGVIHRDLKPDNVFLIRNLDELLVKVLDFGIAKTIASEGPGALTHTGAVLGSPHYMSPEQARGKRDLDHRTDLWALAVIAFECVTGRRPFESEVLGDLLIKICTDPIPRPSELASLPPGFDAWFVRALERDPNRRFSSALEMVQALRALVPNAATTEPRALASVPHPSVQHAVQHAVTAPIVPSIAPARSTSPLWIAAALVVPLIGIILAGIFLVVYLEKPDLGFGSNASASASPDAPMASGLSDLAKPPPSASSSSPSSSTPRSTSTPKTAAGTTTAAPATTGSASSGSDACQRACAKIAGCGEKCNFGGPCVGIAKTVADCINSKKSCLDMASCGG